MAAVTSPPDSSLNSPTPGPSPAGAGEGRALLILGPTASGKSALALAAAEELGGEIVNADSMQVYRDLRIITARPSAEEEARAPHHLYGHVDAGERYSVGKWVQEAKRTIGEIQERGRTAIVIGGTGLYFKALTEGLLVAPAAPEEARALERRLETEGVAALHAELGLRDAEAASRISVKDAPRIIRALSVIEATGRTLKSFETSEALKDWVGVALTPERGALYRTIDARFLAMLQTGALEEASALLARELDAKLPAMKAHGVPALIAHLRGEIGLDGAAAIGQRDTRRYAKRQFTWIAHQIPQWRKVCDAELQSRLGLALAALRGDG
ncbi:MAG: tRNA (adenosine(37)-N6)-dimethylallyltransferase MiaA [Hyphomonadaceae bacterium]|nr:tRNA (adenosine(37)-N6)-dimethylallyltransferase MiaA [Hyphomonadaceae bacterium]